LRIYLSVLTARLMADIVLGKAWEALINYRCASRNATGCKGHGWPACRKCRSIFLPTFAGTATLLTTNGTWELTPTGISGVAWMKRSAIRGNIIATLSGNERISARVRSWFDRLTTNGSHLISIALNPFMVRPSVPFVVSPSIPFVVSPSIPFVVSPSNHEPSRPFVVRRRRRDRRSSTAVSNHASTRSVDHQGNADQILPVWSASTHERMAPSFRSWFDRLTTNGIFCSMLRDGQHGISGHACRREP
jgi:hypothetical protein